MDTKKNNYSLHLFLTIVMLLMLPNLSEAFTNDSTKRTNSIGAVLTSFNIIIDDCHPLLLWTSPTDSSLSSFKISRKMGVDLNYKLIGWERLKMNASADYSYTFIDDAIDLTTSNNLSYKIEMIDINQQVAGSLSKKFAEECQKKKTVAVLFLNPCKEILQLGFAMNLLDETYYVDLFRLNGQVLFSKQFTGINGNQIRLSLTDLSEGTYFIRHGFSRDNMESVSLIKE